MAIPKLIPIGYLDVKGSPTRYIGTFDGGKQFFGFAMEIEINSKPSGIAVLHRFDKSGRHIGSDYEVTENQAQEGLDALQGLLSKLGKVQFEDIRIRLFKTKIFGTEHGLIADIDDEDPSYECVNFEPTELSFEYPWDGSFST